MKRFTDYDQVHDQAAKIGNHDTNLRSNRTNPAERLVHHAGVGRRLAGMSESEQKLHRDVGHESHEQDQNDGRDYAEHLESERNRHDSGADNARRHIKHRAGDRRRSRSLILRR